MLVIKEGVMPDKTLIQLEDWSGTEENIPFANVIGVYPISREVVEESIDDTVKPFRCTLSFASLAETESAFDALVSGKKTLNDFSDRFFESAENDCV